MAKPTELKELVMERVPIDTLAPNPWNPNRQNELELAGLADSIKGHNQTHPILVRTLLDGTMQILGGYHRWKAMQVAGFTECWVINQGEMDDADAKLLGLQDNIHGNNLPLEYAKVIYDLTQSGMSLDTLARKIGKPRIELADALRVLDIPQELKDIGSDLNRPHVVELTYTLDDNAEEATQRLSRELAEFLETRGAKIGKIETRENKLRETVNVLTVWVTQPQRDVVELAIKAVQETEGDKVKRGRALELIAADFLAGHRLEAKPDLSLTESEMPNQYTKAKASKKAAPKKAAAKKPAKKAAKK